MAQDLGFFKSLQDIGSSTGKFARDRLAEQASVEQRKQKLADSIELFKQQQQLKQQFATPKSALEQLIEQAKGAEAAKTMGDEQLFNQIRGGGQFSGGQAVERQPALAPQFGGIQSPRLEPTQQEQQAQQSLAPRIAVTERQIGDFGRLQPKKIVDLTGKSAEQLASESVKASAGIAKEFVGSQKNILRTSALFGGLVAQLKGKAEEQQGKLGLIPGLIGGAKAALKQPGTGRIAAFEGQKIETSLALNNILTGQNRVIKDVVKMINKTLPEATDPEDVAAAKIAQSLTNAFKLSLSFEKGLLSPREFETVASGELGKNRQKTVDDFPDNRLEDKLSSIITLSPEEQQVIDNVIQQVLATPATQPQTLGLKKKQPLRSQFGGLRSRQTQQNQGVTSSGIKFTIEE